MRKSRWDLALSEGLSVTTIPIHSEGRMAARLRQAYPSGVEVETSGAITRERLASESCSLLDTNHDGIQPFTKQIVARTIILRTQLGGSAALAVAVPRRKDGIPRAPDGSVDDISMFRKNDALVPRTWPGDKFLPAPRIRCTASRIRAADPTAPNSWGVSASTTRPAHLAVKVSRHGPRLCKSSYPD